MSKKQKIVNLIFAPDFHDILDSHPRIENSVNISPGVIGMFSKPVVGIWQEKSEIKIREVVFFIRYEKSGETRYAFLDKEKLSENIFQEVPSPDLWCYSDKTTNYKMRGSKDPAFILHRTDYKSPVKRRSVYDLYIQEHLKEEENENGI